MKVLLISPYFAPYTGVGALRMTSLAAYLQRQGADITVVKIADTCLDAEMTRDERLPGVTCVEFDPGPDGLAAGDQLYPLIDSLCRDTAFDCCVVSFGPFYTVRPAIYVKERYGVPLVVDYRDLWLYSPRAVTSFRAFLGRQKVKLLNHRLEVSLMKACSAFVSVTPLSVSTMVQHYPVLENKSYCIYNGYSGLPLQKAPSNRQDTGTIKLCIIGKAAYYSQTGIEAFLQAVHTLSEKNYPLEILHIGGENLRPFLEKAKISEDLYCNLGQLPYDQAMSAAESADIFVAVVHEMSGLGTKLFDYIYLNRPLVAYTRSGSEFAQFLSGLEGAFACQTAEQMASAIETIITEGRKHLTDNEAFRKQFSRERQNERYYQLLRQLQKTE